jgi:hypothetical protein
MTTVKKPYQRRAPFSCFRVPSPAVCADVVLPSSATQRNAVPHMHTLVTRRLTISFPVLLAETTQVLPSAANCFFINISLSNGKYKANSLIKYRP